MIVMFSQIYTYVKAYKFLYFKYVHLIICQLYLNKTIKNLIEKINISLDFTNLGAVVCWNWLTQLVRADGYIFSEPVVKL